MLEEAIILAGGRGSRLKEITDKIPKPLVKVQNKTIKRMALEKRSKFI